MTKPSPNTELYERLLKDRIVLIGETIDDTVAHMVVAQILYLVSQSREEITLYINSPGGVMSAAFAIYDAMRSAPVHVATVCIGQASGAALMLMAAGQPGKRFALPQARLLRTPIQSSLDATKHHQLASQLVRMREEFVVIMTRTTTMSAPAIGQAMDANRQMTVQEAKTWGFIDGIISAPH